MPAQTITIGSLKGGVGKTKVATNLAAGIALNGHRVLLVDLDPQAAATEDLALEIIELDEEGNLTAEHPTVGDLLAGNKPNPTLLKNLIHTVPLTEETTLDVIGAALQKLEEAEPSLATNKGQAKVKEYIVDPLTENYDYIIFDTAPNLGAITRAAIYASTHCIPVLAPRESPYFRALSFTATVEEIDQYTIATPTVPFWVGACWDDSAEGRGVLAYAQADNITLLEPYLPVSRTASTIPNTHGVPAIVAGGQHITFVTAAKELVANVIAALPPAK